MIKRILRVYIFFYFQACNSMSILFTPAVSIIISRVFSDFHRKQLKKSRRLVYACVYSSGTPTRSIRFNLDSDLDRRTRNKNTWLDCSRELWKRRIKIVCNFVSDCDARAHAATRCISHSRFPFRAHNKFFSRENEHLIRKRSLAKTP